MGFSNNLRYLRKINNVTQAELAEYLHVSRPTIAGYETKNKQPDYDKLIRIASFFSVSTDYLLSEIETSESMPEENDSNDLTKHAIITRINKLSEKDLPILSEYIEYLIYREQKKSQNSGK